MSAPLSISVAPNGARRSKQDHPGIALTAAELALEAQSAADAGAVMIHLHVRDSDGRHSLAPDDYRRAIDAIRARIGERLLIQITTEAAGMFDMATQMGCVLAVRPAAASFAIRELIPEASAEPRARDFFAAVREMGTEPQFILYHPDEIARLRELQATGVIEFQRPAVLFVLGRYSDGIRGEPRALLQFLNAWGDDPCWTVCSFGPAERAVAAAAIALGGHVRVGFENNMQRPDGSTLTSNAEQVAAVAALAQSLGRPLASR